MTLDEIDFTTFWKLSSIYEALLSSAVDSVVFPSEIQSIGFAKQYYDTFDDQETMIKKMWARLSSSSNEIRDHFILHAKMRDEFYSIEELLNAGNRNKTAHHILNIHNRLIDCVKLIHYHQRVVSDVFLGYPSCAPGRYFLIKGTPKTATKEFNPEGTLEGMRREIEKLAGFYHEFSANYSPLPSVQIIDSTDTGDGINDTSLRGRIELTRELLKRVGYIVIE